MVCTCTYVLYDYELLPSMSLHRAYSISVNVQQFIREHRGYTRDKTYTGSLYFQYKLVYSMYVVFFFQKQVQRLFK